MDHIQFYKELGKLLYAIANADGMIREKEVAGLQKIIAEELVPQEVEVDEYGVNDAWYTEYEFEELEENAADVETAFNHFVNYYKEHRSEINQEMKVNCMRVAEKAAQNFVNMDHFEKFYLKKLRHELFSKG
jgi:hypothetical protein